METIRINNKRLSKYLYSLGFDRQIIQENKTEYWLFKKSNELQESLDFYFYMRKKNRNQEMLL